MNCFTAGTKRILAFSLLTISVFCFVTNPVQAGKDRFYSTARGSLNADPGSLIGAVNALRIENGLSGYFISPILMAVAQQHAQYMSVAGVTHVGLNGSSPWQRGLAAGYPLAGDLSLGGFYSENITAGINMSAQDAVISWQADAPHLTTMLSPNLSEIGAGVVVVGDYVYYVIDCAQPTNGRQVLADGLTPPAPAVVAPGASVLLTSENFKTIVPATPQDDGKVYHTVKSGETLWLIAISYGIKIVDLRKWNNLTDSQEIYPGDKLFIKQQVKPTLVPAMMTGTPLPVNTVSYTSTVFPSLVSTDALVQMPSNLSDSSTFVFVIIIIAAVILAAVLVWADRKR